MYDYKLCHSCDEMKQVSNFRDRKSLICKDCDIESVKSFSLDGVQIKLIKKQGEIK